MTAAQKAAAVAGDSACRRGTCSNNAANIRFTALPVLLGGSKGCIMVLEAPWFVSVLGPGISGALGISSTSEKLVRTVGC